MKTGNSKPTIEEFCASYGITREWLESPEGCLKVRRNTTCLPDGLKVGGKLILWKTKVTELPENLYVGELLEMCETQIRVIPNSIQLGGHLFADHSAVSILPKNLHVPGILWLSHCKDLKELPEFLYVGSALNICYTGVSRLPNHYHLGGSLYAQNSLLTELPDPFFCRGSLDLANTPMSHLPNNLVVLGYLRVCYDDQCNHDIRMAEIPAGVISGDIQVGPATVNKAYRFKDGPSVDFHPKGDYLMYDSSLYNILKRDGMIIQCNHICEAKTYYFVPWRDKRYMREETLQGA